MAKMLDWDDVIDTECAVKCVEKCMPDDVIDAECYDSCVENCAPHTTRRDEEGGDYKKWVCGCVGIYVYPVKVEAENEKEAVKEATNKIEIYAEYLRAKRIICTCESIDEE